MKDVTELAGVSTATVSRVINHTSYVEPVMQQRVEHST
ncbi:LacI family DNA-binding transcriptional regulator [Vibrio vulnificus]|nr:LacI family DNA-binding transcriptional regulator [Vibrio vulnificus]